MENVQIQQAQSDIGVDAFTRTADALVGAADSLVLEFQRRKQTEVDQAKREEQQNADLRQKLVNIYEKIGALLAATGDVVIAPRRGRKPGSKNKTTATPETQHGRAVSEETEKALGKVLQFVKANPEVSRGDIARNTKLDTSLVGRALQMLATDGIVKMAGERRGAVWSAK